VAGYINPVTGQVHNVGRADTQTLLGAVCFLIGAVLLLPERTREVRVSSVGGEAVPAEALEQ
jgi:hypothetical protein